MIKKEDIITTDKYLQEFSCNYFKTDVLVQKHPIVWRNIVMYPPEIKKNIIITGHSDYGITDDLVDFYNPNIWWTVNKQTSKKNIFSLPLGITNETNESWRHSIYSNTDCMLEVINKARNIKNLAYMNFNITTYPVERNHVYDLFVDKEWVTKGHIEETLKGRQCFLEDIRNHKFVLCPRGNGVDTHRLWETLYMGSIPIVKNDIAFQDFQDLPICFVDEWKQITPVFLENEYTRIISKVWNTEKLKVSYWIAKIHESF
jgi:hypothetical protein